MEKLESLIKAAKGSNFALIISSKLYAETRWRDSVARSGHFARKGEGLQ